VILIAIFIVFAAIAIAVYYYLEKTKSQRLNRIRKKKHMSPQNEAYNKMKRTKGITKMMKRKGKDTKNAEQLVERAEEVLDKGDLATAEKLVDKATEKLPKNSLEVGEMEKDEKTKKGYTIDELDEIEFEESEEAKKRREELEKQKEKLMSLPKNYLESKFQMKLVKEMIEEEDNQEANEYYRKAEKCFESEDYDGALKYSVRCKKVIEGKDAGLIPKLSLDKNKDATEHVEEDTVTLKKCPDCGLEGKKDENFCPKCGIELVSKERCPECDAAVNEEDKFCRKCGVEIQSASDSCTGCGNEIDPEDDFCSRCGTKL